MFVDLYEMRQKAQWDLISAVNGARIEGKLEDKLEGDLKRKLEVLDLIEKGYTAEDIKRELTGENAW